MNAAPVTRLIGVYKVTLIRKQSATVQNYRLWGNVNGCIGPERQADSGLI